MVESDTDEVPVQPTDSRFEGSEAERIRETSFPMAVRGYDRNAVDEFVNEMVHLVRDLESRQSRETVVQRALNEVGEETAGILQRAHETADEIAARSRSQADGRIQRAEREAEITRRQADEYSEHVVADTRLLWEERQRLLEDIRQLADEVLATADEAAERVSLPEQLAADPEEPLEDSVEQPTAEVEFDLLHGGAEDDDTNDPELANGPPTVVDAPHEQEAEADPEEPGHGPGSAAGA
jgi:DivIVA domain-containing protein